MDDAGFPDVLRVRRLEVVDGGGRVRMVVGDLGRAEPGGEHFGVEMRDGEGRPRATVAVSDDGAWMLVELSGNARIHFGVNDPGSDAHGVRAFLYVCDDGGTPVAGWRVDDDGVSLPVA